MTDTTKKKMIKILTWVIVLIAIVEGFVVTLGISGPLNWLFLGSTAIAVILLLGVYVLYWWTNRSI
ncbi:hypothetical protein [Levilactobacillus yiduensis]|uniref:hypothetical protein n=1 Tax=Levilactobacillus yiduensis TaxID=2953880 RepID=UPI001AD80909|nr:hypothetical protein [Levilactobacillus yiduensis]